MRKIIFLFFVLQILKVNARDADIGWGPTLNTDKNIYVATTGDDVTGDGSISAPYQTITKAKAIANTLKTSSNNGVTIWFREGVYTISTSVNFSSSDGGTAGRPIIFRAYPNENIQFTGAKKMNPSKWATYSGLTSRLNPAVTANQIQECSLSDLGLSVSGIMPDKFLDVNNAFYQNTNLPGVYWNGKRQDLARFPNRYPNYMEVKTVVTGGDATIPGVFQYKTTSSELYDSISNVVSGRESKWAQALSHGIYFKGYWRCNWQIGILKATAIDTIQHKITLTPGWTLGNKYKLPAGSGHEPYYVINLLEEIDQPGEWCIDALDGKMYIFSPANISTDNLTISDNKNPMFSLTSANYIQFIGIEFMNNLGNVIKMTNCSNVQLMGCIIHDVEYDAVSITGGSGCGVLSSNLYDLGAGGVYVGAAGSVSAPSNHFVTNCHIYNFGYMNNVYSFPVNMGYKDVALYGAKADHNLFHDCPHTGVLQGGYNNLFEYNDVFRIAKCSNDVGMFYCFNDSTKNGGNIIRYNLMHNSPPGNGVYFDYLGKNDRVYSNMAYQLNIAYLYRPNWNQVIENNMAYKCVTGFQFAMAYPGAKATANVSIGNYKPYVLLNGTLDSNNISYYTMNMKFANEANLDFSLLPSSPVFKDIPNFVNFPSSEVGLYIDGFRITKEQPSNYKVNASLSGVYGS